MAVASSCFLSIWEGSGGLLPCGLATALRRGSNAKAKSMNLGRNVNAGNKNHCKNARFACVDDTTSLPRSQRRHNASLLRQCFDVQAWRELDFKSESSIVGVWDRPERLVLMIVGALANRMSPVLWILAIGPNITVIHRTVHLDATEDVKRAAAKQAAKVHACKSAAQFPPTAPRGLSEASPILTRSAGRGR